MKKFIFAAVACISLTISAQAQQINYGLKAGVTISTLEGIEVGRCDERTGFTAGFYAEFPLTGRISVQPELLYNEKGGIQRFAESDLKGLSKHNYHYISLPVAFKYRFYKGLAFELGPELNYLAFSEVKNELMIGNTTVEERVKTTDDNEPFDVAALAGLSYATKHGITFGVRYTYGFLNTNKENSALVSDLQNRNVQLTLGFRF